MMAKKIMLGSSRLSWTVAMPTY